MSPHDNRTECDGQTQLCRYRILFVCLGNICRSPAAEIIFNAVAVRKGISDLLSADSCGTASCHCGQKPDRRMLAALERAGYAYGGHLARRFGREDFSRFDLIVPQDHENEEDILYYAHSDAERAKVRGMWNWFPAGEKRRDVPDPYYGGTRGFDDVISLLEQAAEALSEDIRAQLNALN